MPIILQLIQELADYEKEPNAVEATNESLLNTLAFEGSDPVSATRPARAILAFTPSGAPAGMALYFYNYSTWRARAGIWLEDLFIREAERGNGYGQTLLGELAKEVLEMKGGRLEWCVLKWNTPSIEFYERLGAKALTEWQTMRVDGEGLEVLAKRAAA